LNQTYRRYLLGVLLTVLAFNYVDRLALGLLLQDIKIDLQLSDTQLGLLSGIAFAAFYSVMGIPIARWADRGNRVTIISLTAALWSVAVALCGLAANFTQLLLVRIGVAVGEAGCVPPAHSLIGDYFTRAERPRALAIYMLGAPLSALIGYFLAGWLNEFYGWRATFIMLGLPGLVLAAWVRFTLKEPRREQLKSRADDISVVTPALASTQPSLAEVCSTLGRNRTFVHLLLSFAVVSFFGQGIANWQPAFFARSFGLQSGQMGTWFAVIYGLAGLVGTYWGGALVTRFAARDECLQLQALAVLYAGFGILSAFAYLSSDHRVAFGVMGSTFLVLSMVTGPQFALIQALVPEPMRAQSIAFIYLFSNLIGLGLGPLAAGALSDALRSLVGEESMRYALLALNAGYLWASWHLWLASRSVMQDLQR
jgi:MFS family permease